MTSERLEVLHDGGEVELIACPGEAAQSHALEAMVGLEVCKAHFDLLAFVAGFGELERAHQRTSMIASFFVLIARDLA